MSLCVNAHFLCILILVLCTTIVIGAERLVARRRHFSESYLRRRIETYCGSSSFKCESGECITENSLCDGKEDCKDGSDETRECVNIIPCSSKFLFQCDYGACINKNLACDGKADCKDNSDESASACKNSCGKDRFQCNSGQCINEHLMCDGVADCADSSDETVTECSDILCPAYTYRCQYGACVQRSARCNGIEECYDSSDEAGCDGAFPVSTTTERPTSAHHRPPQVSHCSIGQFRCNSGECLSDGRICDGKADCADNSDETSNLCTQIRCPSSTYRCTYGACVDRSVRCNGIMDCLDNSDEMGCSSNVEPTRVPAPSHRPLKESRCSSGKFRCNSGECLSDGRICDGKADCADNSDETSNLCSQIRCPSYTYRCKYGACVDKSVRCNGITDCLDKSDELGCSSNVEPAMEPAPAHPPLKESRCSPGKFRCNSGECMSDGRICDGKADCADNSDETSNLCSQIRCPSYTYRCKYGACVDRSVRCNGIMDCFDNSDEMECSSNLEPARKPAPSHPSLKESRCSPGKFKCNSGECLTDGRICDGKADCADNSDETSNLCSQIRCPSYTYRCKYGACVDRSVRCNGIMDCLDNSDELGCSSNVEPEREPAPPQRSLKESHCSSGKFRCNSGECLTDGRICDGIADCADNSDETSNLCSQIRCPSSTYRCEYGACVDRSVRCNGIKDCLDNSDETGCSSNVEPAREPAPSHQILTEGSCVMPNNPTNGAYAIGGAAQNTYSAYDVVSPYSVLLTSCNQGYSESPPEGTPSVCLNGTWTPSPGACSRPCSLIKSPSGATVECRFNSRVLKSCDSAVDGAIAIIPCTPLESNPGIIHSLTRTCRGGSWDSPTAQCLSGQHTNPNNTVVNVFYIFNRNAFNATEV